jgi:hypothetical protein
VAPIAFVAILLLALFVSGTVVSTSQRALPGERLYGVKRTLEGLALATSLDQANDAELQIRFVEERFTEARALIVDERYEDAEATLLEYEHNSTRHLPRSKPLKKRILTASSASKQLEITASYQLILAA